MALLGVVGVVACSDDPAATTPDAGSSSGGPEAGTSETGTDSAAADSGVGDAADSATPLPTIDRFSISSAPLPGTFAACVNAIDTAVKGMGGDYVAAGTGSTFSRYANRPGAVVTGTCIDTTLTGVTAAWAIDGAADVSNDELRLRKLAATELAPAVSTGKAGLPTIRAEKKIHAIAAVPLSTCLNRAEKALNKLLTSSPVQTGKWSSFTGASVRAVGVSGTSASITCIGDTGTVVVDVFTIDPAIPATAPVLNTIVTEFTNAT